MVPSTGVESPGVIGVSAAVYISALHISAAPAVHDAYSIVFTHYGPPAVNPILNVHTATVDRTNRAIRTNIGPASAL